MVLPSMYRRRWRHIHAFIGRNMIALRVQRFSVGANIICLAYATDWWAVIGPVIHDESKSQAFELGIPQSRGAPYIRGAACIRDKTVGIYRFIQTNIYFTVCPRAGYSLYVGWYICAAVLTPFLTFWGLNTIFFGYSFSSTNTKTIFLDNNPYRIQIFWPQIPFLPWSFRVQFSVDVCHFHVCETQRTCIHATDTTVTPIGHQMAVVACNKCIDGSWSKRPHSKRSHPKQPQNTWLPKWPSGHFGSHVFCSDINVWPF